jgi:hypothetical protein
MLQICKIEYTQEQLEARERQCAAPVPGNYCAAGMCAYMGFLRQFVMAMCGVLLRSGKVRNSWNWTVCAFWNPRANGCIAMLLKAGLQASLGITWPLRVMNLSVHLTSLLRTDYKQLCSFECFADLPC